jgi:hypothetical protein
MLPTSIDYCIRSYSFGLAAKTQVLPEEASQLLIKINQGIPPDLHAQYQMLLQKQESETLTEIEHSTLIQLSNQCQTCNSYKYTKTEAPDQESGFSG